MYISLKVRVCDGEKFKQMFRKNCLHPEKLHIFLVLGLKEDGDNATEIDSIPDLSKCGVNYCPAVDNPDVNKTEIDPEEDNFSATSYQLYILAGVYLACSILSAVVLALFVDPLSK